jgi:hypothetical protein
MPALTGCVDRTTLVNEGGYMTSGDNATPRGAGAGVDLLAALVPEQRALLERLAEGETIAAAAAAEFMSLRTANRRMAEVRELFGAATSREALSTYRTLRDTG